VSGKKGIGVGFGGGEENQPVVGERLRQREVKPPKDVQSWEDQKKRPENSSEGGAVRERTKQAPPQKIDGVSPQKRDSMR